MRKLNKNIDVLATFRTGAPPEPHKFRVRDRFENVHVLKIGQILDITKEKTLGYDIWNYRCQGRVGNCQRAYEIQYNVQKSNWKLVRI